MRLEFGDFHGKEQAREQIYEIVGPVLLIFVSPSITGVRTTDKIYQTGAFFSFN